MENVGGVTTEARDGRASGRGAVDVRLAVLARVSTLVGSDDLEELLPKIAQLSVPELADWCAVDVLGEDQTARRISFAHRDPGKGEPWAQIRARFKPWEQRDYWPQLLAGRSLLYEQVEEATLMANVQTLEDREAVRQLGVRSGMVVPLRIEQATRAVMTFATTSASERRYTSDDLLLAEEIARRAAALIERARLMTELKAANARFRIALEMSKTSVYEQNRELRYVWSYNVPVAGDIRGKTTGDVLPEEIARNVEALKRRVLAGEPYRGEARFVIDGNSVVVRLAMDPLRDDQGAINGLLGATTDITEETLIRDELAQEVKFREQLMGILGHDLRNPLSAVVAAAGLLRRRPDLAPALRHHVERIERAADRMTEMIATLLDVTTARFHGRLPVHLAPCDLGEVARWIVDEFREAAPGRDIALGVHGDTRGRYDAARLGELLSNLVGNALVHGAADEPIKIDVDVDGDDVLLRVHNGGAPISPALLPQLFEPFRRGDASAAAPRGLGLGLYIVRQIAVAHGGDIHVDSEAQTGTTFTVRLPRQIVAAAQHV
jgi:signal transduction histidine kinase